MIERYIIVCDEYQSLLPISLVTGDSVMGLVYVGGGYLLKSIYSRKLPLSLYTCSSGVKGR